jgi:hypothetical protein
MADDIKKYQKLRSHIYRLLPDARLQIAKTFSTTDLVESEI